MQFNPFFINSNICLDNNDINGFDSFMSSIAGNTGNSYITYALIKELCGGLKKNNHIQNIYEYDFTKSDKDIDLINNQCTHVFLILQDQIRLSESYGLQLPYKNIINFIKKLNKPVIIAGLGHNSFGEYQTDFYKQLNPDLIDFLKFLSDNSVKIGIRGHYTEEILHNIGIDNTRVIGCPSFFEMGRNRVITKSENIDIDSVLLLSSIPLLLKNNHQIMQDKNEENVIKAICFNQFDSEFSEFEFKKLMFGEFYHIFSNIEEWKNFISDFKFSIGTRVHGSICSINAGVPALCTNGDNRAKEMCEFLKIPRFVDINENTNIIDLYNNIDIDAMNKIYPSLYDNFVEFLSENNLSIAKTFDKNDEIIQPSIKLYGENFASNIVTTKLLHDFRDVEIRELKNFNQQLHVEIEKSNSEIVALKEMLSNYIHRPTFIQQIFSVKNDGNHKVVRIFGIKIKVRRKSKCQ